MPFDVLVLSVRERLDRRLVLLRGVREVRQRRVDIQLERALAGDDGLDDADRLVLVGKSAARLPEPIELPVEAVVPDLILGGRRAPRGSKEGAEAAPSLDV